MNSTYDIPSYWNGRAESYAVTVACDLEQQSARRWERALDRAIDLSKPDLHILDVGTGPGFFALLLARRGCKVTGIDSSPAMLNQARRTTVDVAELVTFLPMDAEHLDFADNTFDAVITRNLTWTLPNPLGAYEEWHRVLKPGGVLLNFDANWYHYLDDEKLAAERLIDQADPSIMPDAKGAATDEQCARCEKIAAAMPLTHADRPAWDKRALETVGFQNILCNPHAWQSLWSNEEALFYHSSPLFSVTATK